MNLIKNFNAAITGIFNSSIFFRYVFCGGTAAAIDVVLLYVLVNFLGVHYLWAATVAVTASFIVRFFLQKYIAFRKVNTNMKTEFTQYSILYLVSLLSTNLLLYLLVGKWGMGLIFAQIMTILLIACGSFFIYRYFIFKA